MCVDERAAFVWVQILPIAKTGSFAVPIPDDTVDDYNSYPEGVERIRNIRSLEAD